MTVLDFNFRSYSIHDKCLIWSMLRRWHPWTKLYCTSKMAVLPNIVILCSIKSINHLLCSGILLTLYQPLAIKFTADISNINLIMTFQILLYVEILCLWISKKDKLIYFYWSELLRIIKNFTMLKGEKFKLHYFSMNLAFWTSMSPNK